MKIHYLKVRILWFALMFFSVGASAFMPLHVFDGGLSVQEYAVTNLTLNHLNSSNLTTESIRGEGMGGGVGGMVYSIRNGQLEASHSNHRGDVVVRTDNRGTLNWFARYKVLSTTLTS